MISGVHISIDGANWIPLHGAHVDFGQIDYSADHATAPAPVVNWPPKIEIEVTVTHFNRGGFELVMGLHTRRAMRCRKLRSVVRSARRGSR